VLGGRLGEARAAGRRVSRKQTSAVAEAHTRNPITFARNPPHVRYLDGDEAGFVRVRHSGTAHMYRKREFGITVEASVRGPF
jgi:hypothetical protein